MRTARQRSEFDIYHVIARGTSRQLIFEDDLDRSRFLEVFADACAQTRCVTYAWCLMGNHVHILIRGSIESVGECMRRTCGGYAQLFNMRHGRVGHLFQERYKSEPVESDSYLLSVVRYIHMNPQKAGIARCEQYAWSSYGEYAAGAKRGLCETAYVLDIAGGVAGFVAFHRAEPRLSERQPLDVDGARTKTRSMSDDDALLLARQLLGIVKLAELKSMEKSRRNEALASLLQGGLSVRQIERLTGIGRGVVQAAAKCGKGHDKGTGRLSHCE